MSKRTITRTFLGGLVAFVAGLALLIGAAGVAYAQGNFIMDGPDVVGVRSTPSSWSMLALAGLAVLAMLGGLAGQFVAWIAAVVNTAQLPDKTWFLVLLTLGLLSFGFVAMVVYVAAGPDDRPVTVPVAPGHRDLTSPLR